MRENEDGVSVMQWLRSAYEQVGGAAEVGDLTQLYSCYGRWCSQFSAACQARINHIVPQHIPEAFIEHRP